MENKLAYHSLYLWVSFPKITKKIHPYFFHYVRGIWVSFCGFISDQIFVFNIVLYSTVICQESTVRWWWWWLDDDDDNDGDNDGDNEGDMVIWKVRINPIIMAPSIHTTSQGRLQYVSNWSVRRVLNGTSSQRLSDVVPTTSHTDVLTTSIGRCVFLRGIHLNRSKGWYF